MSARRANVLLFVAASVIAVLSGALAGALTLDPPAEEPAVDGTCIGAGCATRTTPRPVPTSSTSPAFEMTDPCDDPDNFDDPECAGDEAFDDGEDEDGEDGGNGEEVDGDGDNSGPGSDSSGPG